MSEEIEQVCQACGQVLEYSVTGKQYWCGNPNCDEV